MVLCLNGAVERSGKRKKAQDLDLDDGLDRKRTGMRMRWWSLGLESKLSRVYALMQVDGLNEVFFQRPFAVLKFMFTIVR